MFGTNRTFTPKQFDVENEDTLVVTSIFYTIQGEGPFAGQSAIFIRLAHCNLNCLWCDTYFDSGDTLLIDSIIQKIWAMRPGEKPLIVVTGGEPTLQRNLPKLCTLLKYQGYKIQIESNGNFYLPLPNCVHVVVSPKVNEKTGKFIKLNAELLEKHVRFLKFVVSADPDSPYHKLPRFAFDWIKKDPISRKIYISPMNMYAKQPEIPNEGDSLKKRTKRERISFWTPGLLDQKQNQANHEYAARLALEHGFNLSIQMHLYASLP